jgi:Fe-S cluster assembly protein SufD
MNDVADKISIQDFQDAQYLRFQNRGLPTKKEEQWKYTDVSRLQTFLSNPTKPQPKNITLEKNNHWARVVFINGHFSPENSDLTLLPEKVHAYPLNAAPQQFVTHEVDAEAHPFVVLNMSRTTDGIVINIPGNTHVSTPIQLLFLSTQQNDFMVNLRNIITVGKNSHVTIIEEYVNAGAENYFTNAVTTLNVHENSVANYYKIQNEHVSAAHIASLFINQQQNCTVSAFNLTQGALLSRDNVWVKIDKRGAACHLSGFYHLKNPNQHVDHHLHVDHIAAHSMSSMNYKGILATKSRAVFNGKVYVHQDAQHIQAQQQNHNLLLSAEAEVNTKPELEIYADDVKCTHGATVGQLDTDALFYLQARGISKEAAMDLLTHAFAEDVFNRISCGEIKKYIEMRAGRHE